jgi:hypothetical protein
LPNANTDDELLADDADAPNVNNDPLEPAKLKAVDVDVEAPNAPDADVVAIPKVGTAAATDEDLTPPNVDELTLLANNGADNGVTLVVGAAGAAAVEVAPNANNDFVCGAVNVAPPNAVLLTGVAADETDDCRAPDGAPNANDGVNDECVIALLPVTDEVTSDAVLPRTKAVF